MGACAFTMRRFGAVTGLLLASVAPSAPFASSDLLSASADAYREYRANNFSRNPLTPPGSSAGWTCYYTGSDLAAVDSNPYDAGLRLHIAPDATRFRVAGVLSNFDEWIPCSVIGSGRHVRARYYLYMQGQENPDDPAGRPNFRLRLANRFAVTSMLEVFHNTAGDPGNVALGAELSPSRDPARPSCYKVDFDMMDLPYLTANGATEGVLRGVEAYAVTPLENGYLGIAESTVGTYGAALTPASAPPAKVYATLPASAGDLAIFNPATEWSCRNLVPGACDGCFGTWETTGPIPTYSQGGFGITLDSGSVPADRIGVATREFNPDRNTLRFAERVRVEPDKLYSIRWHLTSTQQVNRQAHIRLRARAAKFAWSQKLEIGGAWGTCGGQTYPRVPNNIIAQEALPGVGCANPDRDGTEAGGWYTVLLPTPLDPAIRADFPDPTAPVAERMPLLAAEPGPGAPLPSRRDILLGMDLIDTISSGLGKPLEQGHVTLRRIEVRVHPAVPD
ncbi:MAG: hypothetical protein N2111_03700 [Candidatus Sumerlaeaceae bacterium]|nr:hypothetical protein [Candidatus Sumerlaeaceae bacterium]